MATEGLSMTAVRLTPRDDKGLSASARREHAAVVALMLICLVSRIWVLVTTGQFSADEAVPGLMARHILINHELPVFYWGQDYFGAAEAYLIALLFAVCGWSPWLVFVPAVVASVVLVPLTWSLANLVGARPAGLIAAMPIAIAPPVLGRELVSAAGGFSLSFALMATAVLCAIRAAAGGPVASRWVATCALVSGFAMWIWQPALVALPPLLLVVLVCVRTIRRTASLAVALLSVGLTPALAYNAARDWPTLSALMRKAAEVRLPGDDLASQFQSFAGLLLLTLGGGDDIVDGRQPIQGSTLLAALLITPLAIGWLAIRSAERRGRRRGAAVGLLVLFAIMHTLAAHQAARYLVPLVLAASVLVGVALAMLGTGLRIRQPLTVVVGVLIFGVGNLCAMLGARPPEPPQAEGLASLEQTQLVLTALVERGLSTGYADYWTAYPITYLSGEQIVVAPTLPFLWRARTDRFPPYTARVDGVVEPGELFALVDRRCALQPYLQPLDEAEATYRVDPIGHWYLVWRLHTRPREEATTLAAWRTAIRESVC